MTVDATRFKTLQTNSAPKINPDLRRVGVAEDPVVDAPSTSNGTFAPKAGAAERRTPPAPEAVEIPGLPKRYQLRALRGDALEALNVIREMNNPRRSSQEEKERARSRDPNATVIGNGALNGVLNGKKLTSDELNALTEEVVRLYPAAQYPRAFDLKQVTADFDAALTALQAAGADINASSIYYRAMDDEDTKTPLNYFVWANSTTQVDLVSAGRPADEILDTRRNSNESVLNGLLVLLAHGADPKTITRGTIETALFEPGIDISAQIPDLAKRGIINLEVAQTELTRLIDEMNTRNLDIMPELRAKLVPYPDNTANLKVVQELLAAK